MGTATDVALVCFLIFEVWCGWRSGLLWQVASLASIGLGLILGAALAPTLGHRLATLLNAEPFQAQLLAFLLVAGLIGCALRLMTLWAEAKSESGVGRKERERRRGSDRVLGGIFGALKSAVLAMVALAVGVGLVPNSPAWESSRLVPPLAAAGARVLPEGAVRELESLLASSADRLCKGLEIRVRPLPDASASRGDAPEPHEP